MTPLTSIDVSLVDQQKLFTDEENPANNRKLRFSEPLEKAFTDDNSQRHSNVRIFGLVFLALFALPPIIFEAFAGRAPEFAAHALPYQLLLITIPCGLAAVFAFVSHAGLAVRMSCYASVFLSSIGWVVLSHIGHRHQVEISYLFPSGTLLLSAGLLHISVRAQVLVALFVSAAQIQAISLNAAVGYSATSILMLCFSLNAVSIAMAWYHEASDRRIWFNTRKQQHKVYVDELTQLLNRRGFWHYFSRLARQSGRTDTPISLLVISVDNFANYQQEHGYANTDDALLKIGELLADKARRPFDLIARLDAGTYAICWDRATPEFVAATAEEVIKDISELHLTQSSRGRLGQLTASGGCTSGTVSVRDIAEPEDIIAAAGASLQKAHAAGGNVVLFSDMPL